MESLSKMCQNTLQDLCLEREHPILLMGWTGFMANFWNAAIQEMRDQLPDSESFDAPDYVDEMIEEGTFYEFANKPWFDTFLSRQTGKYTLSLSIIDKDDCSDCGMSSTIHTIETFPGDKDWEVSSTFGCYGGESYRGSQKECLEYLAESFNRHFYSSGSPKADKRKAKEFLRNVKEFNVELPTDKNLRGWGY